ncbi:MAG: hypothetical protein J2P21_00195 [Chloracidobacterium sp.]|nr:hypothetical protein [Chloracidobacterium sp.]
MKISADTFCKKRRKYRETGRQVGEGKWIFPRLVPCLLVFFIAACGKMGDPLPPLPRAQLRVETLGVEQRGSHLILSFPFKRDTRTKLQRVDVYRLVEPISAPMGLPVDTFSERASMIYSILADDVPLGSSDVVYKDPLIVKSNVESKRYRYAVRTFDTAGRATDFSNYATIEPLFNLSLPPDGLAAKQAETQIEITWNAPADNINETTPANVAGYNIYRGHGGVYSKINAEPLREPHFSDRDFQFGVNYQYVVRSLSFKPGSASMTDSIESDDSRLLDYTPKDTFPPAAPKPITIASINSIVSVFWPLSAEPDVVGYNIYRTDDENAPPEKWVKLNPDLYKTASFRDDHVQVGKIYFYQITAVDTSGNESARSEVVSETVAP